MKLTKGILTAHCPRENIFKTIGEANKCQYRVNRTCYNENNENTEGNIPQECNPMFEFRELYTELKEFFETPKPVAQYENKDEVGGFSGHPSLSKPF